MKKTLRLLVKPVLFLAIFMVIFLSVQRVLTPKWRFNGGNDEGEDEKYGSFYQLPRDTLDYLTIGASQSYFSVTPIRIYSETGITGYCLGSSGQSIEISYYWLKEALKTQSPKYIFIDVNCLLYSLENKEKNVNFYTKSLMSMNFSWNKIEAIWNCKRDDRTVFDYLFPILQFHTRWNELTINDFKDNSHEYYLSGARIAFSQTMNVSNEKQERDTTTVNSYNLSGSKVEEASTEWEISDVNKLYFEKIYTLCEQSDIILIPTRFPTYNWNNYRRDIVQKFLESYGFDLLDISDGSMIGIHWPTDTADDARHVNYWGNVKTSDYFAKYLSERLPETNHRQEAGYEHWDETLEGFCEWEQDKLISDDFSAYQYLQALQQNSKDIIVLMTVRDEASGNWNDTLENLTDNLGLKSTFYHNIQNAFIGVIDGGTVLFEKWDENRMTLSFELEFGNTSVAEISMASAGFVNGNTCSITVNDTEYALKKRGLNIVVLDKATGQVISSVSIDSHTEELTFTEKTLPEEQAAIWQAMYESSQLVEDGVYTIAAAANRMYVWDIPDGGTEEGLNLQMCERNGFTPQQFELTCVGDGVYTIRAVCSDQYLGVENMGNTPETRVVQQSYTGLAEQKWFITENSNKSYTFTSLYSGLPMDVWNGIPEFGVPVQTFEANGELAQQFILEKAG